MTMGKPVQLESEQSGVLLEEVIDRGHELVMAAERLNWKWYEQLYSAMFYTENRPTGLPMRLMVGLHFLKYAYELSDEKVLAGWLENPHWQYFCGGIYFEHELPLDSSVMSQWRERIKRVREAWRFVLAWENEEKRWQETACATATGVGVNKNDRSLCPCV